MFNRRLPAKEDRSPQKLLFTRLSPGAIILLEAFQYPTRLGRPSPRVERLFFTRAGDELCRKLFFVNS